MDTALVTGATSGIGRAIAIALKAEGLRVIALGRNADALNLLQREFGIHPLALDVTDHDGLRTALANNAIDVLVNNAGLMPPVVPFDETTSSDIDAVLGVNVSAVLHLTRLLVPGMRARKRGHVFFTGSTAGHATFPNMAVYSASKAAIGGFAAGLRVDMAPYGVRVTEIVAGRVETSLYRDILPEEVRKAMYANQSAVQPENVAEMVLAVLRMPQHVDVARFDILPTHQVSPTGVQKKG